MVKPPSDVNRSAAETAKAHWHEISSTLCICPRRTLSIKYTVVLPWSLGPSPDVQ